MRGVFCVSLIVSGLSISVSAHRLFLSFPSPQEAGIVVGDTLQKVNGEDLGSYKEGMALFKKQTGTFTLTLLREADIVI